MLNPDTDTDTDTAVHASLTLTDSSMALAFFIWHFSCGVGCHGEDHRRRRLASHWSRVREKVDVCGVSRLPLVEGNIPSLRGGVGALVAEETPPMYVVERRKTMASV